MKKEERLYLGLATVVVLGIIGVVSLVSETVSYATTSNLTMSATINPSSTITINADSVNLDITPSASGTLKSSDALRVSAYTNTNYECNVTMTASSSSLVSGANSIPTLATGTTYTDATFTNDSWGYKIGTNGEYKSVLTGEGANAIKTISSMTGGTANTTDIFFAAKLTPATKPGTYTNTVTFASTCTPPPLYMQDATALELNNRMPNVGDTATLYDKRDEEEYLVAKLADNKYWMLDNLRLDPTAVSLATLQGNTNATNAELNYLKNGGGTTSDQYATAGVTSWTSSYSYSAPIVNASYKDTTTTSYGLGSGKIGVYYNYCAASAGSYCYGNGTSAGTSSGNATSDICPSGWRMPSGYNGEYSALISAYNLIYDEDWGGYLDNGSASGLKYNLSTPLSGNFINGSAYGQGADGRFWSSTRYNYYNMYYLYVDDEYVSDDIDRSRSLGLSVRCIASF